MTPKELVLTFGGLHLCVNFGENRQRNATVRVMTHGQTHRQTDRQTDRQTQTDFIICPIAICYSYGADNNYLVFFSTESEGPTEVLCCNCFNDSTFEMLLLLKASRFLLNI